MKLDRIIDLLIDAGHIDVDGNETNTRFSDKVKEAQEKIEQTLSEEQKKLFSTYRNCLETHLLLIRDEDCKQAFYYGFQVGQGVEQISREKDNV